MAILAPRPAPSRTSPPLGSTLLPPAPPPLSPSPVAALEDNFERQKGRGGGSRSVVPCRTLASKNKGKHKDLTEEEE
eukprot:CAMPEP_0175072830 /NCGR_PEP_ID=MMETSP0052_2-20121109/20158_1 /TAXON_ID=51329 ORGANISM="Polytomella parva, Strain SAG 63-3" /NCGR_SAMPLE_ID=MMETSP0052_2 /ASSEMBLY_ACC=CAM_ASM_000194 /LENGTH=76 /DNA_ID=CAMNT_0016340439 /DNA_START=45 /DNA_END=275 /DNA_ORIENTATION=-